jgi:hypothetical protein
MEDANNPINGNQSGDAIQMDQKPAGGNRRAITLISIIVLVLIIALIIFVYMPQLKPYVSTTTATTTLPQTTTIINSSQNLSFWNVSEARIFNLSIINSTFGSNSSNYYTSKANYTIILPNPVCEGTISYLVIYSIPDLNNTLSNASLQGGLNPKLPFLILLKTTHFNTTQNFDTHLLLCPQQDAFTNSSYAKSLNFENVTGQIGAPAELYIVSNFTHLGLDYQGLLNNTPPISIYLLGVSHNNIVIRISVYYLTQYANETKVLELAKSTYSNILNSYLKQS